LWGLLASQPSTTTLLVLTPLLLDLLLLLLPLLPLCPVSPSKLLATSWG
jgi:hypothetical protein